MVESAMQELAYFDEVGFDLIKISVKASNVPPRGGAPADSQSPISPPYFAALLNTARDEDPLLSEKYPPEGERDKTPGAE